MDDNESRIVELLHSPEREMAMTPKAIYGHRPPSSSKRPQSANPKIRISSSSGVGGPTSFPGKPKGMGPTQPGKPKKGKAPVSSRNEEWDFLLSFAREDLASAIVELKKEYRALQSVTAQLRAENQRTENELLKQQRRIDKLVSPHVNGQSVLDIRKEIEKSILVRQLKGQINILRETVVEKDRHIEKMKTSQKASHLMEIKAEKDEYFMEIGRLRTMLQEMGDELDQEKKRIAGDMRHTESGTETELRKEVGRLSFGYQELLARMTGSEGQQPTPPSSSSNTSSRSPIRNIPTNPRDESQFTRSSPPRKTVVQPVTERVLKPNTLSPTRGGKGGAEQFEDDTDLPTQKGESPVENTLGDGFGLDAGEAIDFGDHGISQNVGAGFDDSSLDVGAEEITMTALPTVTTSTHKIPVGTKVSSRFRGGESFYNGSIKAHNADGSYWVCYDDGDEEHNVDERNIKPLKPLEKSTETDDVRKSQEYADDFDI
jgi:hypothetical protein